MTRIADRIGWGLAGALALALIAVVARIADAGPLDPQEPPGETAGVLRPGTPIRQPASPDGFPIILAEPGSYYLVENIVGVPGKSAIQVLANDVNIDLSGFAVIGGPGTVDGITDGLAFNAYGTTVHGGTVRDFEDVGIDLRVSPNARIYDVTVIGNVVGGIQLDSGSVSDCTVAWSGLFGALFGIRIWGPASTVERCATRGYATGIALVGGGTVRDCEVNEVQTTGVYIGFGGSVTDCHIRLIGTQNGNVRDAGIDANGAVIIERNLIEELVTQVGGSAIDGGVWVSGSGSVVRFNTFEFIGNCSIVLNGSESSVYSNSFPNLSVCTTPAVGPDNFVAPSFQANQIGSFNPLANVWH